MPTYEELYRKLLELEHAKGNLILPYPIEEISPLITTQNVPLSEHDRLVQDFYRIMAKATHSEVRPAHYLKKTN